jgi:hypothetical protein
MWSLLALSEAARALDSIRNWIRWNERCPRWKCHHGSSFSASVRLLFAAEHPCHMTGAFTVNSNANHEAIEMSCQSLIQRAHEVISVI